MKLFAATLATSLSASAVSAASFSAYRMRPDGQCVEASLTVDDLASTGFREGSCLTAGFSVPVSAASAVYSLPISVGDAELETFFDHFKDVHSKVYESDAEEQKRFAVFAQNARTVVQHNAKFAAGEASFWMGFNSLADLTQEEYQAQYLNLQTTPRAAGATVQFDESQVTDVPDAWDWRKDSNATVVTPVKNQGSCGSCWAFSAVATMEGRYALDSGDLQSFSEQELVDCTLNGEYTCELGGEMHDGIMEIVTNHKGKINTEAQYPYKGRDEKGCKADDSTAIDAEMTGYANVTSGDETALKAAAYARPVISVGIDASSISFQLYLGGVYDPIFCSSTNLDHGVSVVGYGTSETGKDYWWVKNSWGGSWGEKGYVEMIRNKKNHCGIATDACYALSKSAPN